MKREHSTKYFVYRSCKAAFKAKRSECLQKSFLSQAPSLLVLASRRKEGQWDMAAFKPPLPWGKHHPFHHPCAICTWGFLGFILQLRNCTTNFPLSGFSHVTNKSSNIKSIIENIQQKNMSTGEEFLCFPVCDVF